MTDQPNTSSRANNSEWNANLYDTKHAFVWKYGSDVISLLDPRPGECILDLGSGTGHLTSQIAEAGARVVGIDKSEEMVRPAREAYPDLSFEVADARNLHFHEEFDAVFSNATLHWIREPIRVIVSVRHALRSGGRFVAEFGGKGNIRRMQSAFEETLVRLGAAKAGQIDPWYFPSVSEYSTLLEKNGFEVHIMTLFDRLTPLSDGEAGLRNWILMFASDYLAGLPPETRGMFFNSVESRLASELFRDGQWWADYRRLRLVAVKI